MLRSELHIQDKLGDGASGEVMRGKISSTSTLRIKRPCLLHHQSSFSIIRATFTSIHIPTHHWPSRLHASSLPSFLPAATLHGSQVAVKFFTSDVSPDGRTIEEVRLLRDTHTPLPQSSN